MIDDSSTRLTLSRREMLRSGTVASAVGIAGIAASTGSAIGAAHCDVSVDESGGGDHTTIQDGVDAASSGDTICVAAGTYEEAVTVDKDVTLEGANPAGGPNAAVVDGSVEVSASDATVASLEVAPTDTVVAGGLDPHGILVTGSISGVTVEGNVVEGLTADSTGASVTINGIQVWNDGPDLQSGTVIRGNVVRDMDNDGDPSVGWPNYGGAAAIKVQGVVEGTRVVDNTVDGVHSAGWTYGVVTTHTNNAPGISPKDTTVEGNTIEAVNDGSVYDVFDDPESAPYPGSAFAVDGDSLASEVTANFNNFLQTPIGAHNKDEEHSLDATCDFWGHPKGPDDELENVARPSVDGDVDDTPWNTRRIGRGRRPGNSCVGGERTDRRP